MASSFRDRVQLFLFPGNRLPGHLINPGFAIIWVVVWLLVCLANMDLLRFKLFARRKESISTCFEPAEIPTAVVERYEKASSDLLQVMVELEQIAAENEIAPNEGLRRWSRSESAQRREPARKG